MSSNNLLPCSIKLLYLMLVTVITSLATPVTRLAIMLWYQSSEAQEQMEDSRIRMQDAWNVNEKYNLELLYTLLKMGCCGTPLTQCSETP